MRLARCARAWIVMLGVLLVAGACANETDEASDASLLRANLDLDSLTEKDLAKVKEECLARGHDDEGDDGLDEDVDEDDDDTDEDDGIGKVCRAVLGDDEDDTDEDEDDNIDEDGDDDTDEDGEHGEDDDGNTDEDGDHDDTDEDDEDEDDR